MENLITKYFDNEKIFQSHNSIYKYQYCNYLDFDEKITYGFFDPGRQTDFFSSKISDFKEKNKKRKIIFCDDLLKHKLKFLSVKISSEIKKSKITEDNYYIEKIINEVNNIIKKPGVDVEVSYNDPEHEKLKEKSYIINKLKR